MRLNLFTGLIEEIGIIKSRRSSGSGVILEISAAVVTGDLKRGDSVSINGACQTVTDRRAGTFCVFASEVTLANTTLGRLPAGCRVNLERAISGESRFGGHLVQGHVDCTGTVSSVERDRSGLKVTVKAPAGMMKYVVERGSVAVDGISLTVVSVDEKGFGLYVIPETASNTTVNEWKKGAEVNLEADIIAKYVEKMIGGHTGTGGGADGLMKKLGEEGFV